MSDKCFDSLHFYANEKLFGFARELRRVSTPAEKRLWKYLRNGKLDGLKFRRQHPIMSFVVDFYCHEKKLVIECDGTVHDGKFNEDYDEMRTNQMIDSGITVQRFRNDLIMNEIDLVFKPNPKNNKYSLSNRILVPPLLAPPIDSCPIENLRRGRGEGVRG